MACHAHTYEISGGRKNSLLVCPMRDSRSWLHVTTKTTDKTFLKKVCPSPSKNSAGNKEKKNNGSYKAFSVTAKRNKI